MFIIFVGGIIFLIVGGIIAFFVEVIEDSMYYRKKRKERAQKELKSPPQKELAISRAQYVGKNC